ncbi:MAG: glutamate--tRNA ligase [Caldilineaceae bacterium SB0662_bin_9]|uniref:Glutamate--tRNA ligase n=1 Tax=Caldilineaceae bacterium SB0662_bin_9 TaxID=2605258 RepID=A0A6B1DMR2_9CHLR|nr:glutamate--tRNA ligase [Caldilineaceae bacterium SB0662_bin_9]
MTTPNARYAQVTRSVRTRFAPSPTGQLHLGGLRTALFTWLWARHNQGTFILRIEDTDSKRFDPASVESITSALKWLELDWDEGPEVGGGHGPYVQSERGAIYRSHAEHLIEAGHAYRCFCSPARLADLRHRQQNTGRPSGYDGHCRRLAKRPAPAMADRGPQQTIRLAQPETGSIQLKHLVRGRISVDAATLHDPVLLKSDGMAVYHLAVVVDDHLMGITDVLRGQEWLPTAPYHRLLYQAFEWDVPVFVHLPVILNPNGEGKMSKRRPPLVDGAIMPVHVDEFRDAGYLPEAMFNFLALLGWTADASEEVFPRDELIRRFDVSSISAAPATMPYDKLAWMNGLYLRKMEREAVLAMLQPYLTKAFGRTPSQLSAMPGLTIVVEELVDRIRTLSEAPAWLEWLFADPAGLDYPDPDMLLARKQDRATSVALLKSAADTVATMPVFNAASLETAIRDAAARADTKPGLYFGCMRAALSGTKASLPLFPIAEALGQDNVVTRLRHAAQVLEAAGHATGA